MRQLLVTIGSELAVITGLLYYFGWVRTAVQADRLGFSSGVLNLSVADYLLKSVTFLFPLLVALLLLLVAAHVGAGWVRRRWPALGSGGRRPVRAVKVGALVCAAAGVLGSLPPLNSELSIPVGLTLAVVGVLAARSLQMRAGDADPWTAPRRWLVTLLLIFLVFWDTERVARFFGDEFAADVRACPEQFPAIAIYSKDDLALGGGEPTGSDYKVKYNGLRLMEATADRYVLITADARRVFVLAQSDSIRVEFEVTDAEARCGGP